MEILRPSSSEQLATSQSSSLVHQPPQMEIEDFICVLQIEPSDTFMALELARRLVADERLDEALRVLRAVVRMDNQFQTLLDLGLLEYRMELQEASFEHLQQALMIAPESAKGLFEIFKTLGNIFVRRGDFQSAEESYFRAHRIHPESDVLYVNLGTLAIQRQAWDEAAEKFRTAIGICKTNDKAWVGLAVCHRMKGDHELAWGNLEAALQTNPLNEVALQLIVDWGQQEGLESRVFEHLRTFLVKGGWNEKMSLAFVWFSFKCGHRLLASLELERLLAVNPCNESAIRLAQELRSIL